MKNVYFSFSYFPLGFTKSCFQSENLGKVQKEDPNKSSCETSTQKLNIKERRVSDSKAKNNWADALHFISAHPDKFQDQVLDYDSVAVVVKDLYPKVSLQLLAFNETPMVMSDR